MGKVVLVATFFIGFFEMGAEKIEAVGGGPGVNPPSGSGIKHPFMGPVPPRKNGPKLRPGERDQGDGIKAIATNQTIPNGKNPASRSPVPAVGFSRPG